MKRFFSIILVAAFIFSAFQTAEARDHRNRHRHHRNHSGEIVVGAIIGTALGVAIGQTASQNHHPRNGYVPQQYYSEIDTARSEGYERARQRYEREQLRTWERERRERLERAYERGEMDFYRDIQERYRY